MSSESAAEGSLTLTVCTLAGEVILREAFPSGATIAHLREKLISCGEQDFDLVHDGRILSNKEMIFAEFTDDAELQLARTQKKVTIKVISVDGTNESEVLSVALPEHETVAEVRKQLKSCSERWRSRDDKDIEVSFYPGKTLEEGQTLAEARVKDGAKLYVFADGRRARDVGFDKCPKCEGGPAINGFQSNHATCNCDYCGDYAVDRVVTSDNSSCFSGDSVVIVRTCRGLEEPRNMARVKVGDVVCTGVETLLKSDRYRRVTRVWSQFSSAGICTISPGCRLTEGHPIWWNGRWQAAGTLERSNKASRQKI